jgi:hypothetical protein
MLRRRFRVRTWGCVWTHSLQKLELIIASREDAVRELERSFIAQLLAQQKQLFGVIRSSEFAV